MLVLTSLFLMVVFLLWEKMRHQKRLKAIPIRIHVNGTRGKSSLVRLLAAVLRENGIVTLAKTTGDFPQIIRPDGTELSFLRRGGARLQEQVNVVKMASSYEAQAIVIECMALHPEFQEASETTMVQATHTIMTNVRRDHAEVMGRSRDEIAGCLALSLPGETATLICTDRSEAALFARWDHAPLRRILLAENETAMSEAPISSDMERMVRCVAGALEVTYHPSFALALPALPQPVRVSVGGGYVSFLDLFSINDIDSFLIAIEESKADLPGPKVALFNTRSDRPLRTASFIEHVFLSSSFFDYVALAGSHKAWARRKITALPLISCPDTMAPDELLRHLAHHVGSSSFSVIGVANFSGLGEKVRSYIEKGAS